MSNIKSALLAVSAGLVALGIVLMGAGFALGGFDPRVFMMNVDADRGTVQLGTSVIENPEEIPLLNTLMDLASPEAPDAPDAPAPPDGSTQADEDAEPTASSVWINKYTPMVAGFFSGDTALDIALDALG